MPGPTLGGGRTFDNPPQALMGTDPELYEYLFLLHARVFGIGKDTKGDLDLDNINPEILPNIPAEQAATHTSLVQGVAVESFTEADEVTATALSITEVDATAIYGVGERDLINELKTDLNLLFTEYNVAVGVINEIETKLNDVLSSLKNANLIAP